MKRSIQTTIRDCVKALRGGVAEEKLRWALVSDGWKAKRADLIVSWAKMHIKNSQADNSIAPVTVVTDVDPEDVS